MKFKHTSLNIKRWTLAAMTATILFAACKKDLGQESEQSKANETQLLNQKMENPLKR